MAVRAGGQAERSRATSGHLHHDDAGQDDAGQDVGGRDEGGQDDASTQGKQVAAQAAHHGAGQVVARLGIAARAGVYLVVSYLAVRIANGAAGGPQGGTKQAASGSGAVHALAGGAAGRVALVVLTAGLIGYAVFSTLDAVLHHNDEDNAVKRWGDRLLSLWGAVLYVGFAVFTVSVLFAPQPDKQTAQQSSQRKAALTSRVLQWPGGRFLVAAVAVIVLAAAIGLYRRALIRGFRQRFEAADVPAGAWRVLVVLGTVGILARAVAYSVVAALVMAAAVESDPRKAQGLDGALRTLAGYSWGPFLLFPIAIGLGIFALYLGFEVRYRRVGTDRR